MATGVVSDSLANARTVKIAHTAAVVKGEIIVNNGQVLMAVNAAAISVDTIYIYRGKIEMPKEAALAIDHVRWCHFPRPECH